MPFPAKFFTGMTQLSKYLFQFLCMFYLCVFLLQIITSKWSKPWSNKRLKGLHYINYGLISIVKCIVLFNHFLEAGEEIEKIVLLVFGGIEDKKNSSEISWPLLGYYLNDLRSLQLKLIYTLHRNCLSQQKTNFRLKGP